MIIAGSRYRQILSCYRGLNPLPPPPPPVVVVVEVDEVEVVVVCEEEL
jgi:hypothetical protein